MKRFSKLLQPESTALLIIDIQERILKAVANHELLLENTLKLIKGFNVLELPIFYTEQYPKGLGHTVQELKTELKSEAVHKLTFSCFGAEDLFKNLIEKDIKQIVVCGVEAHVCVQQTVLDLLENGFQVNLAADAVSSRKKIDYETAVERMRAHKAEITTVESALFELLNICGTAEFKSISKIIK